MHTQQMLLKVKKIADSQNLLRSFIKYSIQLLKLRGDKLCLIVNNIPK